MTIGCCSSNSRTRITRALRRRPRRRVSPKTSESGRLDEDLKYKYRDSLLYEWASGNARKPIHYWILVGMDRLKEPELMTRTDALKGKLPLRGPRSEAWTQTDLRRLHDLQHTDLEPEPAGLSRIANSTVTPDS